MKPEPQTAAQMIDLSDLPVDQAVDQVIAHAVELGASDLMLLANEDFFALQIRQLGMIRPVSIVSAEVGKRFSQHIKAAAGMDIAEHRHPHDGRWIYDNLSADVQPADDSDQSVDLRISTVPTMHGEDMVIRLLSRSKGLFKLDQIGLSKNDLAQVQAMLDSPGGLVLCCGPTGSGKTATLYAALDYLNSRTRKINTIEDPIEFAIQGLRQSQVRPKLGVDFPQLLKGVLRQSPDIIMIGEIRDKETATTAVHAANSGHLVLSTIHAPVAAAAIDSMRSLGVNNHFLATALRGVLSQRLVRTLDPERRVEYDISHAPQVFEPIQHLLAEGEGKTFYAPGASEGHSGYSARTGVFEVMTMSHTLREMVSHGADTNRLREQAHKEGSLDFKANALLKVARGITSIEEVFRVVPAEYLERFVMLKRVLEPEVMDDPAEASAYDAMDHTQPNLAFVNRLLDLGIERCAGALDLGTGPGDIPILICGPTKALSITAVDLAQSMLDLAEHKVHLAGLTGRITLKRMDVKALDLPDHSFDAVFSNTILHHLPEPTAMLREAARVLRPGGLLLIRDLFRPASLDQLNALVAQHALECNDQQRRLFAESLHAALTPDELRALAQQCGLADAQVVIDTDRHMSLQIGKPA